MGMATLTKNRGEILRKMAEGMVIEHFPGWGNRMKPRSYLVGRPKRVAGTTEIIWGQGREEIRNSDYKALFFELKYLDQFFSHQPHTYYEINQAGKNALERK